MARLTRALDNSESYIVDDDKVIQDGSGYSGEAINKLAKFENMCDDLAANQNEISKKLEALRDEGKTNLYKFKELMAQKLTNSNMLILLKTYGLQ